MARRKKLDARRAKKSIVPAKRKRKVKLLIYGRTKRGKTFFAGTSDRLLLVDCNDRGEAAIAHTKADVAPCEDWVDIASIYWFLKSGDHKYKTVCIDTLTSMQALCMKYSLKELAERDPTRDPKMPAQRDYGKVKQHMEDMIYRFRNLPMHVIFLAQERTFGDPDEGEPVMHVPNLTPSVRDIALSAVDGIGRIYVREVKKKGKRTSWERRILFGTHEEYETGNRLGLPRIMRNPTMADVIEATNKEED